MTLLVLFPAWLALGWRVAGVYETLSIDTGETKRRRA